VGIGDEGDVGSKTLSRPDDEIILFFEEQASKKHFA